MIRLNSYDIAAIKDINLELVFQSLQRIESHLGNSQQDAIVQSVLDEVFDILIENCTFTIYE